MAKKRSNKFADVVKIKHDGDVEQRGCRVYSRNGDEYGLSLGVSGVYAGEAGRSTTVRVVWKDDQITKCNVKGLKFENGRWQIRR